MNPETTNNPSQANQIPTQVAGPSKKCKNKNLALIIILAILAVGGLGFGGFELWQNIQKDDDIKNLQADKTKLEEQKAEKEDTEFEISEMDTEINTEEGENKKDYYLFSNYAKNNQYQRYQLVTISGGMRTAFNSLSSEDDDFYILDMKSLGTANDLRKIDLVSLMSPLTKKKINDGMPEYASYNVYSDDDKLYLNQCESFLVEYKDANEYLIESYGLNYETDIPIAVDYICQYNNGSTRRLYNRTTYILNAEQNTVKEFTDGYGFSTSDFTNK